MIFQYGYCAEKLNNALDSMVSPHGVAADRYVRAYVNGLLHIRSEQIPKNLLPLFDAYVATLKKYSRNEPNSGLLLEDASTDQLAEIADKFLEFYREFFEFYYGGEDKA